MPTRSVLDRSVLESLRERVRGDVIAPGDTAYDAARRIWNGRFDRRPAAIARCTAPADVQAAVTLAREHGLRVAVRSGGHDYAGNSVCDDGLVIDLSAMDDVRVDPEARTARVQAGARWRKVDLETQAVGLATTGGTVSTVGVAGFTLGGGHGYLERKHGLAVDNLLSAEVVTADGTLVRASERDHPDLFWGLRGGSGNLGIATAFEFRLHPVGPQVFAGQIVHTFDHAREGLRFYRSFMASAPDEVQCYAFLIRIPPVAPFPEALHGRVVLDLVAAYMGDPADGERVLAPLRGFGAPAIDSVAPVPYQMLQQAFDAGTPPGNRWYTKAHTLSALPDRAIDTILEHVEHLPGPFTMVYLSPGGGAPARVDAAATAYPHRGAPFQLHIFPGWSDPAEDDRMIDWARRVHADMAPHATGTVYVNMLDGDEEDVARTAWGGNRRRLAEIKKQVDPSNLFRSNHNVAPS